MAQQVLMGPAPAQTGSSRGQEKPPTDVAVPCDTLVHTGQLCPQKESWTPGPTLAQGYVHQLLSPCIAEMPHNKVNTQCFCLRGWNTSGFYWLPLAHLHALEFLKGTHTHFVIRKGSSDHTSGVSFHRSREPGRPPGEAQAPLPARDMGCGGQTAC